MSVPTPLTAISGGITRLRIKGAALKSSLYDLLNAYVTMQGTIKPRGGTLRNVILDKTTKGLLSFAGVRHVFAHIPTTVPAGYQCHVLVNPVDSTLSLKVIHFVSPFMGFPYVVAEFSDGSVYHYWLQTNGTWKANTIYFTGDYVSPTVDNGFAFAATRLEAPHPTWQTNTSVALNDIVEPTVYSGYMFKAIAVAGTAPHTGSIEPNWPTTENAEIQEFGDFGSDSTATASTGAVTLQPGSSITDRYGNPSVFQSQIGEATATASAITAATADISTWQAGTLYQPGAVVQPSTGQGAFINAIPNGDFESGDDGNWVFNSPWAISLTNAYQGTKCAQFAGGSADQLLVMNTYGSVTAGQVVNASSYLNPNNTGNDLTMWMQLKWYDNSNTLLATTQSDAGRGGSGGIQGHGYQYVTVTGTAPSGATRCRVAIRGSSGTSSRGHGYADIIAWDLETPAAVSAFLFEAIQAAPASSGSTEPTWPTVEGNTVVDGGVTWKAIGTSIITWQALPIMKSGGSEPTWPTTIGGAVADGNMSWVCADRRITDPKCPNSKYVAISSSKIFAGDKDIIAFCATTNCLDWSSPNDAGFLPFGLQNFGSEPVQALNLYRSNLVAFSGLGYQMWQTDEDPTNMAILDSSPVGSTFSKSVMPTNNDLVLLNIVGIRNIGIAGASTNLQAGEFGKAVDSLVKTFRQALSGTQEPRGVVYPGSGQYWLCFGKDALVLTINGARSPSWSRYSFPYEITDWTLEDGVLLLRVTDAGLSSDLVWQYDSDTLQDDYYCDAEPSVLSGSQPGVIGTTIDLSWTAATPGSSVLDHYDLYRGGVKIQTFTPSTLSYNDTGRSENTAYQYYVIAVGIDGSTAQSNTVTVAIGGPQAVVLGGVIGGGANQDALLSWTAATTTGGPITGYNIYRNGSFLTSVGSGTTTYDDGGLVIDTQYAYTVTSITAQSESAQSNQVLLTSGHPTTVIDVFTTSSTWAKRAGLLSADIYGVGGGGGGAGGGAGSHSNGSTPNNGGGGGAGGGFFSFSLAAANLAATVAVTIGAAGGGGAGGVDSGGVTAAGVPGGGGGASTFGSGATANGGGGGITSHLTPAQSNGGTASVTATGATSITTETGGKGAQGNTGGAGGNGVAGTNAGSGAGSGGSNAGPNAGGSGASNTDSSGFIASTSGNGGASKSGTSSQTGNAGAAGTGFGAGGGGGGDMVNTAGTFQLMTGGAGGAGAPGKIVVVNHLM